MNKATRELHRYPVNKEQFLMRRDRIIKHCKTDSPMMLIPPIAKMECELLIFAYYGGQGKAVFAMLREWIWLSYHGFLSGLRIKTCDLAGWTKIYDIPETTDYRAHKQRHGRKCSGSPNCKNMQCIEESVPKWFKLLTRWRD